jgi:hypothetical protein
VFILEHSRSCGNYYKGFRTPSVTWNRMGSDNIVLITDEEESIAWRSGENLNYAYFL